MSVNWKCQQDELDQELLSNQRGKCERGEVKAQRHPWNLAHSRRHQRRAMVFSLWGFNTALKSQDPPLCYRLLDAVSI